MCTLDSKAKKDTQPSQPQSGPNLHSAPPCLTRYACPSTSTVYKSCALADSFNNMVCDSSMHY
jgi:hypothetical protein